MTVTDIIHANIDRSVHQSTPDSVFLHGKPLRYQITRQAFLQLA